MCPGRLKRPGPPRVRGQPSVLGVVLADLRRAKGLSLREVQEATDGAVSNAYLGQLERQKMKKPSPNVPRQPCQGLRVPYETLTKKARSVAQLWCRGGDDAGGWRPLSTT